MTTPLFNPDQSKKLMSVQSKIVEMQIKIGTSKRIVKILFTDKSSVEYRDVDLSETKDGWLILFSDAENSVKRYPADKIISVTEQLLPEER